MDGDPPFHPVIRAEHMQCALQDRVFGLGISASDHHWRGILLQSGRGAILDGEDEMRLRGPCLVGLPWPARAKLRISAGGVGFQIAMGGPVMANAIGHNPDSADLRLLTERRVLASLEDQPAMAEHLAHAFGRILEEARHPGLGFETMAEAHLRAILVHLYRFAGAREGDALRAWGRSARILRHFRQLVEIHFRERWTVARYAAAIGISADHLHEVSRRELDRTPRQLIRERVIHEARLRLERSSQTVEQLAGSLGFRDVGHFSRFFRSAMGRPPGAYRRQVQRAIRDGMESPPLPHFSDWP